MSYHIPKIETQTLSLPDGQLFTFRMIEISGGEFEMGAEDDEAYGDEKPVHRVKMPTFWMGEFLVTQALWLTVIGGTPAYFPGLDRPVEMVSWNDITQQFLPKLAALTGRQYRLPSEAEWEYAARGGINHSPYRYAGSNRLEDVGWSRDNSHVETKPVGLKQPNVLGLYDMSGNVYEWCMDHWHDNYQGAPIDGSAWVEKGEEGRLRVLRGGSSIDNPRYCRVSYCHNFYPEDAVDFFGFRLVVSFWQ